MTDLFAHFPTCETCGQKFGGSHYHCGKCQGKDVTSMYGHSRRGHYIDNKWVESEFHFSCDNECEICNEISRRRSMG